MSKPILDYRDAQADGRKWFQHKIIWPFVFFVIAMTFVMGGTLIVSPEALAGPKALGISFVIIGLILFVPGVWLSFAILRRESRLMIRAIALIGLLLNLSIFITMLIAIIVDYPG